MPATNCFFNNDSNVNLRLRESLDVKSYLRNNWYHGDVSHYRDELHQKSRLVPMASCMFRLASSSDGWMVYTQDY